MRVELNRIQGISMKINRNVVELYENKNIEFIRSN